MADIWALFPYVLQATCRKEEVVTVGASVSEVDSRCVEAFLVCSHLLAVENVTKPVVANAIAQRIKRD